MQSIFKEAKTGRREKKGFSLLTRCGAAVTCVLAALLIMAPAATSSISWGQATPVCADGAIQREVQIAGDGAGGAIITWQDNRNGDWDIYAGRTDYYGNALWGADGLAICENPGNQQLPRIVPDGEGGAIVTWEDDRNGNWDIYAQKVDSGGNPVWVPGGTPIRVSCGIQARPGLVSDGAGGAIICWEDWCLLGTHDIYAQRAGPNGELLWDPEGIVVCDEGQNQTGTVISSDGSGGAIITWQDRRVSAQNHQVYAQRVDGDGMVLWEHNGSPVCTHSSNQENVAAAPDGCGGIVVAWQDKRNGNYDVFSQKVGPDGDILWDADGVITCQHDFEQIEPTVVQDGEGGAIVAWTDGRGFLDTGRDIYMQRIDSSGVQKWENEGTLLAGLFLAIVEEKQDSPEAVSDGFGGAFIAWRDYRGGDADIYVQRVDGNGNRLIFDRPGNKYGFPACTADYEQTEPVLTLGEPGVVTIAWKDSRDGNEDVYAQRVRHPEIVEAYPPEAVTGSTVPVTITGRATEFTPDSTVCLEHYTGTLEATLVTYKSPREIVGTFSFDCAVPGSYDVIVDEGGSGDEVVKMEDAFRVLGGTARLLNVWPGDGFPGEDHSVEIEGIYTHFEQGNTTVDFGDGIEVLSVDVEDAEHLTVGISIDEEAEKGPREVNVFTEIPWAVREELHGEFTVSEYRPSIRSVTPDSAETGEVVEVTVEGDHFREGDEVSLVREESDPIPGTGLVVVGRTEIDCNFDLSGASEGFWDLRLESEDGKSDVKKNAFTVAGPAPALRGIDPDRGIADEVVPVVIEGSDFGGTATVRLQESGETVLEAEEVEVLSPDTLTCLLDLAGIAAGTYDLTVINPDGKSAVLPDAFAVTYGMPVDNEWYLAEGTTAWGFDTYISVENPNEETVTAQVTYMTEEGEVSGGELALPARSQTTINPESTLGSRDFSTRITCLDDKNIAVDRTMSWTGEGADSPDGHCSIGVTSPAETWYLPEGSSNWGFECWLLIQNPNSRTASCQVTYMIEGEGPKTFRKDVPANSRRSYGMADDIGNKDASISVTADVPVIAERAMYRNNRREGHDSIGTTAPAADYYLAEGTTGWGFETYVLVQNANSSEVEVTVTYMTPEGPVEQPPFVMLAGSRKTIRVNDVLADKDFSTHVSGSRPIIAERSMYWDNGSGEACHDSIGTAAPHKTFYLPDGRTSDGRETWTLVQNPNEVDVEVEISYLTTTGLNNVGFVETIPANSRRTFNMADKIANGKAAILATCKTGARKIIVERAMYWNMRGAGTDTIGGHSD